jgi:pimeloyl-ACP methyl ester carboxylesterase
MPECGHIPHLEVPDQFFAEFLPFLASQPACLPP